MRTVMLWASATSRCKRRAIVATALGAVATVISASTTAEARVAAPQSAGALSASAPLVPLPGHVHGLAQSRFDRGEAPDSLRLPALEIVFAKSSAQQQALAQLLAAQQDPNSPQYQRWLAPAQYGSRFGASDVSIAALSQWLETNGFHVDPPSASRSRLRFSGSKAQVEAAFHTRIHLFEVDGEPHFANVTDPEVPAALATQIAAIRGLHDFYPRSGARSRHVTRASARVSALITYDSGQMNFVGPTDFATIYNLLPLYQAALNGAGVTLAIAGQSDIDRATASAFWTGFGLPTPPFSSIPVPGGQDPGQTNDPNETEAYLDVEIAGGLAPGASILLVRDKDALNAAQYVIEQNSAAILNISFGACEGQIGGAQNTAISALFQQAAAQGITVTVAAGDAGIAACATAGSQGQLAASGLAVNGIASTPYDLAVGGTEFDPTRAGEWATTNASGTLANALAHIPEMVWNDTCANPLWAKALGYASTNALCNTATIDGQPNPLLEVAGGGGGLSSCITQDAADCAGGYPQPSWQRGVAGIASFGARAIPDVAMIATNWVICSYEDSPCDPAAEDVHFVGGTSAAAPSVAAIIAMLDQSMSTPASPDGRQGLINPQLYALAAAEYGSPQAPSSTASACSASLGGNIGAGCSFYNVVAGSNSMPCEVALYDPVGSLPLSTCAASPGQLNGIMEVNSTVPYLAGSGFNLASGLGSINAAGLVLALYLPAPSALTASSSGQSVNLSWNAEPHATSFSVYQGTASGQEGASPVQSGATGTSGRVSGLQFGRTYYFTVAAESPLGASPRSNEAQATIVPAAPTGVTAVAGNDSVTLTWTAATGANTYNIYQGSSAGAEGAQPVQSGLTATTATITGLNNGTTYYFKVAGVDAGGPSAKSAEAQATPIAPPSGGGGAVDSLALMLLALRVALRIAACAPRQPKS